MHIALMDDKHFATDFDGFSKLFLEREDSLILVAQLNQLIKAVQRHRGISMGMLAGNEAFRNEFDDLQNQLERRLATLEAFARANQLLSDRDKENLSLAWATIRSNWEDDNVNDNFELHSHFIEQLLAMITSLAKKLQLPLVFSKTKNIQRDGYDGVDTTFAQQRFNEQFKLLSFVTKQLPQTIEYVARVRGTSAYSAAIGSLQDLDERKMRFWMNTLRNDSQQLCGVADSLYHHFGDTLHELTAFEQNKLHILQLLNTIEATVFIGKSGRDTAHNLFNMATDITEVYWRIVNQGLDLFRSWHREEIEAWVQLS